MRMLLLASGNGGIASEVDPGDFAEVDFEAHVLLALGGIYPGYHRFVFTGTFEYEGRGYRPDLALVAPDFSHWFVLEVELPSHSFDHHVLPQVRGIRYGQPGDDCVSILARELKVSSEQARTLMNNVPRSVAVVSPTVNPQWKMKLGVIHVQMLTVSVFAHLNGYIYGLDGAFSVLQESLGFGRYSAVDRSLRLHSTARVPRGRVQIEDPSGGISWWFIVEDGGSVWATKETGIPSIQGDAFIQVVRTHDGRLQLRRPR